MVMESSPDQPPPPQPSNGDPNEQLATPGFGIGCNVEYIGKGTGMANGNLDMFNNVDPDIQRAFEKQKIKEKIIAVEIARRRELEAEVREELRIEREMALRMKSGNVFDGVRVSMEPWGKSPMQEVEGLSLEENIVRPVEESLRIQGRTQTSRIENIVKPSQQTSIESKVDETGQEKGKNSLLAKPSADLPTAEKEDLVPAKESATSEADLKQHFTGSKHRSKRAVLKAEKSAAITVEAVQISQIEPTPPPISTAKPLGGRGTRASTLLEKKKKKAMVKENFKLQEKTVQISGIEPLMPTPPPIATAKPLGGHGTSASTPPLPLPPQQPSYGDLNDQLATRVSTNPRNDHLNQGIGAAAEMPWSAERATLSNNNVLKNVEGILTKLTLKGFDVLKDQLLACGITSADILKGVISLIFDKAVLEPTFCPMYAQLFSDLDANLPPFPSDERGGKDITLKRLILNNCKMAFKEAEKLREELRKMTATEQEIERGDKETLLNLRFLGSIRLTGELFKLNMVPEKIVHCIIQDLLGADTNSCPAEENVEAICQFLSTIGKLLDENRLSRRVNDVYFNRLKDVASHPRLYPHLKLMVRDIIDLRTNNWIPR